MLCKTYELNELQEYKYVVILSKYKGKILLSRHKKRVTWETQGGHIEWQETPLEAAKRELYEEFGAVEFDIEPLCDYYVGNKEENGTGGISFYQVMPTYHNASGTKAYIMNMYTNPDYRRKRKRNQANFTRSNRGRKAFV